MSRNRIAVVIGVLVVFVIVGGLLIYAKGTGGQPVTINVTVTGAKTMDPGDWSAHQNDTVTVNITSDTDGEVHLHGYDISFEVKKGQTVSKTFKADKSGSFDIEWERTSIKLGRLAVGP